MGHRLGLPVADLDEAQFEHVLRPHGVTLMSGCMRQVDVCR
jgi:hypothetical protein